LGKERVLTETNGASGWGLDFAYQKRATDWQLAQGINLFCQHLSLYSMEGYRKRDFPLSFLEHQPWWRDYKILADYIGRMSYALSRGKYAAEVLVLHPASSTWAACNNADGLKRIEESVKGLVASLNRRRVMFDLGDDVIMSRHARVEGGRLRIGEMSYRAVLVPETVHMQKGTFELVAEFARQGGAIMCAGGVPDEYKAFFEKQPAVDIERLISSGVPHIRLTEANGGDVSQVYGHIRRDGPEEIIFLCNLDMEKGFQLTMPLRERAGVTRFDGETGEAETLGTRECISFALPPSGSALFVLDKNAANTPASGVKNAPALNETITLHNWSIALTDYNALHLHRVRCALNGGAFHDATDVLKADDMLKDQLGLERGTIFSRQPYTCSPEQRAAVHSLQAEYAFTVKEIPEGPVLAAVELPDRFSVYINNRPVRPNGDFYKDRAFPLYDIKNHIHGGENIIRIETNQYGLLTNLESVYIVGGFSLAGNAVARPADLLPGNIAEQGYPYYSGRITYTAVVEMENHRRARLSFGKFYGVTATVKVNGETVRTVGWGNNEADFSGKLKRGSNTRYTFRFFTHWV
jgi:hypothetical protein